MKKAINENDIKKASNAERCKLILAIIKRTSNLHTRRKNTLKEETWKI